MPSTKSGPYLYMTDDAHHVLVPDGGAEALQHHLAGAGISTWRRRVSGVSAEWLSFDGDPELVHAILEDWNS